MIPMIASQRINKMIWRGIIVLFNNFTIAVLCLSGLNWLEGGPGLPAWIAWPFAAFVFYFTWVALMSEADKANIKITEYLEYLYQKEESIDSFKDSMLIEGDNEGFRMCEALQAQLKRSIRFWKSYLATK